jgi:ribosomal protein L16 Arg81 hydroxylase
MAKESNPTDPMLVDKIEKMMLEALTERSYEEVKEWYDEWNKNNRPSKDMMTHGPVTSADDLVSHLREMVTAGYTDEEIKALHPELTQLFNSESETEIEDEDNG